MSVLVPQHKGGRSPSDDLANGGNISVDNNSNMYKSEIDIKIINPQRQSSFRLVSKDSIPRCSFDQLPVISPSANHPDTAVTSSFSSTQVISTNGDDKIETSSIGKISTLITRFNNVEPRSHQLQVTDSRVPVKKLQTGLKNVHSDDQASENTNVSSSCRDENPGSGSSGFPVVQLSVKLQPKPNSSRPVTPDASSSINNSQLRVVKIAPRSAAKPTVAYNQQETSETRGIPGLKPSTTASWNIAGVKPSTSERLDILDVKPSTTERWGIADVKASEMCSSLRLTNKEFSRTDQCSHRHVAAVDKNDMRPKAAVSTHKHKQQRLAQRHKGSFLGDTEDNSEDSPADPEDSQRDCKVPRKTSAGLSLSDNQTQENALTYETISVEVEKELVTMSKPVSSRKTKDNSMDKPAVFLRHKGNTMNQSGGDRKCVTSQVNSPLTSGTECVTANNRGSQGLVVHSDWSSRTVGLGSVFVEKYGTETLETVNRTENVPGGTDRGHTAVHTERTFNVAAEEGKDLVETNERGGDTTNNGVNRTKDTGTLHRLSETENPCTGLATDVGDVLCVDETSSTHSCVDGCPESADSGIDVCTSSTDSSVEICSASTHSAVDACLITRISNVEVHSASTDSNVDASLASTKPNVDIGSAYTECNVDISRGSTESNVCGGQLSTDSGVDGCPSSTESRGSARLQNDPSGVSGIINTRLEELKSELMDMRKTDLALLRQLIHISQAIQRIRRPEHPQMSRSLTLLSSRKNLQTRYRPVERQNSAPHSADRRRFLYSHAKWDTEDDYRDSLSSFDESEADSQSELEESWSSLNYNSIINNNNNNNNSSTNNTASSWAMSVACRHKMFQSREIPLSLDITEDVDESYEDILKRNVRLWKMGFQKHPSVQGRVDVWF